MLFVSLLTDDHVPRPFIIFFSVMFVLIIIIYGVAFAKKKIAPSPKMIFTAIGFILFTILFFVKNFSK